MSAWIDVAAVRCPKCGKIYVDASWYLVELGSDIQCKICQTEFNSKNTITDRALLEFTISKKGKIENARIAEHLSTG